MNRDIEIIGQVSKEVFRRRLLVSTRVIAILLILAIVWIGFIQIAYVNEVNQIKAKYGSLGYCYLCGQEAYRKCECQYFSYIETQNKDFNKTALAEETALYNVKKCDNKNNKTLALDINFTV